jgi:hypothetical protein
MQREKFLQTSKIPCCDAARKPASCESRSKTDTSEAQILKEKTFSLAK